jgi:hypothetical protein
MINWLRKIVSLRFVSIKLKAIKTSESIKDHKVVLTEITAEEIEANRCKQYKYAI